MSSRLRNSSRVTSWRSCIVITLSLIVVVGLAAPAGAVITLDITRGQVAAIPIAVTRFTAASDAAQQYGVDIASVVSADLERSGVFKAVSPEAFIETITDFDRRPNFGDWRIIKARALVTGHVSALPNARLRAEFRLWDPFAEQQMAGVQFVTTTRNWRRIGHMIADAVYERLTGAKGYFGSRIAFVDETGPKNRRVKRLALMDQDGENLHYLSDGKSLVLTPRFSPDGSKIAYVSYETGRPRVYMYDIATRRRTLIGEFATMTFSPRFSPDGRRVVMSLEKDGNSDIYTLDIGTRSIRKLTQTPAIETAPSYSPDAKHIAFESDREGTQQIYVMDADGTNQHRISFGPGRYSTPVWSPQGDVIAFTKLLKGRFLIGVMKTDGSGERILTEGFHNEGPSWSPNGRVVAFFRDTLGEKGGPELWSVNLTGYNERKILTPHFASDPSWSALLK